MTLEELITTLEAADPTHLLPHGFLNPHSYRGDYMDLAFEPAANVTVADMLGDARSALGATYQGYKGGSFTMGKYTDCWLAEYGCVGETLGPLLLELMLEQGKPGVVRSAPGEPRRFYLQRHEDVTGVSGTGRVADGVLWPDGTASGRWRGERPSTVHWDRFEDAEAIHGHQGATEIVWLDEAPPDRAVEGLASVAVNAGRALQDERRHYEIACQENARLRAAVEHGRRLARAFEASGNEFIADQIRTALALDEQAVPPADQTGIRDRIANAIGDFMARECTICGSDYEAADAVLAVLPAPADRASGVDRLQARVLELEAELAKVRDLLRTENKRANDAIDREETAEQAALEAQQNRAAVLQEAADVVVRENEHCPAVGPCPPCEARTRAAGDLRHMAEEPAR